jgi:AraC-like DNA-binding protein
MENGIFFSLDGPLDALPADLQVRAANLQGFTDFTRKRGGDPREILEAHGLDPRAIVDPDYYIQCQDMVDVFEHCSEMFNDALFGLQIARQQDADVYGCVTALCRAAPTFRVGLTSFIDYLPVAHSPESVLRLVESSETAELRWEVPDFGVTDQANYQALILNLKFLRMLGGPDFKPSYVSLAVDARDRDLPEIEASTLCPVHIRAATNAIAFPAHVLEKPIPTANRTLFRLVGGYLERVKAASRVSLAQRVEDYVRGALPSGTCSIERCARKLGTSVRTLQSRLADSGVRFSDILERQRMELAKVYLHEGEHSLDEVALRLGYSEQTSFGRAFKRWTGVTPQRFRAVSCTATA